ncbi:MAG: hypothetical protein AVDCRST_MAG36-2552 [uncultured Nocardioidaceae bacterium]|uniref:Uncharacterized protein n=1 Tax=uncultured Nocardioidaceae bacterium TaxID=253824 RepID=A0A6J4MH69_9ACTN|nr:MAG: hypothetical protein AVDCRST_MAG36-2552 [uncultured Nocardioidaceae bacterium]
MRGGPLGGLGSHRDSSLSPVACAARRRPVVRGRPGGPAAVGLRSVAADARGGGDRRSVTCGSAGRGDEVSRMSPVSTIGPF